MCPLNLASFVQRPRRWARLMLGAVRCPCADGHRRTAVRRPRRSLAANLNRVSSVHACVHAFTHSLPVRAPRLGAPTWGSGTGNVTPWQMTRDKSLPGDPVTVTVGGNPNVFVDSEQGPEATTPADPVRSAASRSCRAALPHSSWRPCPARAAHSWRSGVYKRPAHRVLDQGLARE